MASVLPKDFKEFLQLLNSSQVQYLLIGGYAINLYGYSRNTEDLDIWVAMNPANAERTAVALREFGFSTATAEHFLERGKVIRMGVPPMRIEVLTTISGVDFEKCYERRRLQKIEGVDICVIDREDLITNKLATGRLKDLADAEKLQAVKNSPR